MTRTDRAARTIPATPEAIRAAFADPDALIQWLPPAGMSAAMHHYDFRTGGSYRMELSYDAGGSGAGKTTADSDMVAVRFGDVEENRRIVQLVEFVSDDPRFPA